MTAYQYSKQFSIEQFISESAVLPNGSGSNPSGYNCAS
jgi:hypothetical protein